MVAGLHVVSHAARNRKPDTHIYIIHTSFLFGTKDLMIRFIMSVLHV